MNTQIALRILLLLRDRGFVSSIEHSEGEKGDVVVFEYTTNGKMMKGIVNNRTRIDELWWLS